MKVVLFCQNPYAFGILEPIMNVLKKKRYSYIWFLGQRIKNFPFASEPHTRDMNDLRAFKADAIYAPGNEVPDYLRGLKVQVFHGLAGEKKSHFKIRHYFDLYLTQGPYFTDTFNKLKNKNKNFDVIETGWSKLDVYCTDRDTYRAEKLELLKKYEAKKIILYAPTFSPSLTSAPYILDEIKKLTNNPEYLIIFKFHDLMAQNLIKTYEDLATETNNMIFEKERNITKFLLIADILISDTSSVVYEFLLLDKPVMTYKNNGNHILWDDSRNYKELPEKINLNLQKDPFKKQRQQVIANYHPYKDGKSALRMVTAVEDYIKKNGVPEKRKLSFLRKSKIKKLFG